MCGICGEWNPGGVDPVALASRNRLLAHRGPDDVGQVVLGDIGLAMTRLSVIDLEHGHQPIPNEDESAWVVFNGEIYNHRDLRADLESRGHRFRTRSDTEVILHQWEESGDRVVESLRGMFAFALWDARRRRLLLARDPFGQKPLFYAREGARFLFGSEPKSVVAGLSSTPELDLEALDDYLTLRFVPSPSTMFRGVRKLPPASLLTLDVPEFTPNEPARADRHQEVRRYWDLGFLPKRSISEREAVGEVRERIHEAVNTHLESDVTVGAFLSGGMDSSLVVASMAHSRGGGFPTFAIGVAEQDFDELPFAREVARYCATDHHEAVVNADLIRLLPTLVRHLDEPSDPIAVCMYHAAALASETVKVVLTGDGGDELFAGFDRYMGFRRVDAYATLPRWVRRVLLGPALRRLPDSAGYKNFTQKARWVHQLSFHDGGRRYAEATVFFRFGEGDKTGMYAPRVAAELAGRDATDCIVAAFQSARAADDLDRMLHADMVTRLPEHSLMLTDRMTMAHGLESRSPFLDRPLAEFVATLPARLKMRRGRLKHLMREASTGLLPPSILRRPKQGFMFPLGYWMRGPLAHALRRWVERSALAEGEVFDRGAMRRLVEEHLAGRIDHHVRLWMILNVEAWFRIYLLGQSDAEIIDLLGIDRPAHESGELRG